MSKNTFIEVETTGYREAPFMRKAKMFKGYPKAECPVTYKKVMILGHSIGNDYNPGTLNLYENKSGVLKYEIYRDGCFYPYYGTLEYID